MPSAWTVKPKSISGLPMPKKFRGRAGQCRGRADDHRSRRPVVTVVDAVSRRNRASPTFCSGIDDSSTDRLSCYYK